MLDFQKLVTKRQADLPGRFCVGLDPVAEKTPRWVKGPSEGIRAAVHMMTVIDGTHHYAACYKPNRAYYEALQDGETGLRMVNSYLHTKYPDTPGMEDVKRGDIDRTQHQYGVAHLVLDETDGMNFSPYMGIDCLKQLVKADASGCAMIIGLGRTSNPAAWEIQDLKMYEGSPLWELVVAFSHSWAKKENIADRFGIVMGAAHPTEWLKPYEGQPWTHDFSRPEYQSPVYSAHLARAREIVGDEVFFLIPGIGKQLGALEETIRAAYHGPGTMGINSSSGICYPGNGDTPEACEAAAKKQCEAIAEIIATM